MYINATHQLSNTPTVKTKKKKKKNRKTKKKIFVSYNIMTTLLKVLETTPKVFLNKPYSSLNYLIEYSPLPPDVNKVSTVNASSTLPYPIKFTPSMSLFAKGKQFVTLYKQGIVNVFKNYRQSRRLLRELTASSGSKALAKQAATVDSVTQAILDAAAADRIQSDFELESMEKKTDSESTVVEYTGVSSSLTWADYQLLLRTPPDILKLPLFSLVFCIFFETTPLVVYLFPSIVPSTCVLPGQVKKQQKKTEAKIWKAKSLPLETKDLEDSKTSKESFSMKSYPVSSILSTTSAFRLPKVYLQHLSSSLSLFPGIVPLSLVPQKMLANAVDKHISRVKADSFLLTWAREHPYVPQSPVDIDPKVTADSGSNINDGHSPNIDKEKGEMAAKVEEFSDNFSLVGSGIWALNNQELVKACQARMIPLTFGKPDTEKSEKHLRMDLFYWTIDFLENKGDAGFLIKAPISYAENSSEVDSFYDTQAKASNLKAPIF